jgi:hypothetical protein
MTCGECKRSVEVWNGRAMVLSCGLWKDGAIVLSWWRRRCFAPVVVE